MKKILLNLLLATSFLSSAYATNIRPDINISGENILSKARQAPRYSEKRQRYLKDYYNRFLLPEVRRVADGGYHATASTWQSYDNLKQALPDLPEENFLNSREFLVQYISPSAADAILPRENILLSARQAPKHSVDRQRHLKDYYDRFLLPEVRRVADGGYHATAFAWQSYDNLKQALPDLSEEDFLNSRGFLAQYISPSTADIIIPAENILFKAWQAPKYSAERQRHLKDYYDNFLLSEVRRVSEGGYHATAFAWQNYDNLKQALPDLSEEDFLDSRGFLAQYISPSLADVIIPRESERVQAARIEARRLEIERIEEIRVAFEEARPANWNVMSTAQKILLIVDETFQRPNFRAIHGLPADVNQQILLKNKFRELIVDNYIDIDSILLPLAAPQNIILVIPRIIPILKTAMNIQKYEGATFNMSYREAKDFDTFVVECNKLPEFPLAFEQKISFFRSLKASFNGTPWKDVTEVMKSILQNSLPMDFNEWPNFDEHPDANFNNFIQNVIAPCINAIRGRISIEDISIDYVDNLLIEKQREIKGNIDRKISIYQDLNYQYILDQKDFHGYKLPLPNLLQEIFFEHLTDNIYHKLLDLEDQTRFNFALKHRINYSNLCADPFLYLLRAPDEKLIPLTENYGDHLAEIQALKNRIINLIPAVERGLDAEFNKSFKTTGFGLGHENDLNKSTMIRIKRLYDCVKENKDEMTAAKVVYFFAAGNMDRCVDGKRDNITELEREHVYVANGMTANKDMDATVGLNLSKLFMDDRMDKLRETINALYNEGEPRTYAWFRSHRAIYLGFGLSGKYEEMLYNGQHREGIDPIDFVDKYFKGGTVRGHDSARTHNIEAFNVDRMTDIVSQEINKAMGGLFDDETLNYMVNSNLGLRRAYIEFQSKEGDATFENNYFKDATLPQRQAFKKEAIIEVLKNYNYVYKRNDDNNRWE